MVDRTLIGKRTDGTYGLDISLPGFDVKTADPKNMAFSTRWGGSAVIHQTGIIPKDSLWGSTVTFPTLPYVPLVYLLMRLEHDSATWSSVQYINLNYTDLRFMMHPFARVTTSSLFFDDSQNSRLPSINNYTVRYCVFKLPGK